MNNYEITVENHIITFIKNFTEENGACRELDGALFIPKDVRGFSTEALIGCDPLSISVEEGNPFFHVVHNCLIDNDKTILLACKNCAIPDDGSVEAIGPRAFSYVCDWTGGMDLDPLRIPDSIRQIGYRAFAFSSCDPIHIIVPCSVEHVGCMALMMYSEANRCTFEFLGSPELEAGVFGTKAESADTDDDVYRQMPPCVYTRPEEMLVRAPRNSSVIEYCKKYGIRFEET